MKTSKTILTLCISLFFGIQSFAITNMETQEDSTTTVAEAVDSFGVSGNCVMCKRTIEKAALGVDGVNKAFWDAEQQLLIVTLNEANFPKTENRLDVIKTAVAKSGYDTDTIKADDKAYEGLHGCCQYDRDDK